mgnify:CR=1 FL=1
MPQDNFVYDHILIRYGELSTKGKNRKDFIKKLFNNVKNALSGFPALDYEKTHDRMYIHLNGEDPFQVKTYLEKVFGISSFSFAVRCDSDIEAIKATTLALAEQDEQRTFKVAARRSWKQFPMISDEINRAVAGNILRNTAWKVNVKTPDVKIQIEVHEQDTYIMTDKYPGAGGGKAMVMLSGGIDSPIASYLTMKRGVAIECVHYASPPYTSSQAREKVLELARLLAPYQGHIMVHIVSFTDLQLAIYDHCDESYAITIMRRMMYRIAERLAKKQNALAIVNGESIGQVASQTMHSLACTNEVCTMPVFRPCIGMDKQEIVDISEQIDTYETSILPYEDCCTIFVAKHPVTKPILEIIKKSEEKLSDVIDSLLEEAYASIEVVEANIEDLVKA